MGRGRGSKGSGGGGGGAGHGGWGGGDSGWHNHGGGWHSQKNQPGNSNYQQSSGGWSNGVGWDGHVGHVSKGKGYGLAASGWNSGGKGPTNDGTAAGIMGFVMSTAQNAVAGLASKHIEKTIEAAAGSASTLLTNAQNMAYLGAHGQLPAGGVVGSVGVPLTPSTALMQPGVPPGLHTPGAGPPGVHAGEERMLTMMQEMNATARAALNHEVEASKKRELADTRLGKRSRPRGEDLGDWDHTPREVREYRQRRAIIKLQQHGLRHDEAYLAETGCVRPMGRWEQELGRPLSTETVIALGEVALKRSGASSYSEMDGDFSDRTNLRHHSTPPVINTPRQRHCLEIDDARTSATKQYESDARIHHQCSRLMMENERLREDVKHAHAAEGSRTGVKRTLHFSPPTPGGEGYSDDGPGAPRRLQKAAVAAGGSNASETDEAAKPMDDKSPLDTPTVPAKVMRHGMSPKDQEACRVFMGFSTRKPSSDDEVITAEAFASKMAKAGPTKTGWMDRFVAAQKRGDIPKACRVQPGASKTAIAFSLVCWYFRGQ